ncbi:MAG TPA: ankyrin repeat domain-containing protein [Azospirillum sp.]
MQDLSDAPVSDDAVVTGSADGLAEAAGAGDVARVQALHAAGADVRADDDAAMLAAARNGHVEAVAYLHANGASLSARNGAPLRAAIAAGHADAARFLYQHGAGPIDPAALCQAARGGHLGVVRALHELGFNVCDPAYGLLAAAVDGGHAELVSYLHSMGHPLTVPGPGPELDAAVAGGHVSVVKYLQRVGGHLKTCSVQAARSAAAAGHLDMIRYGQNTGLGLAQFGPEMLRAALLADQGAVVDHLLAHGVRLQPHEPLALTLQPVPPALRSPAFFSERPTIERTGILNPALEPPTTDSPGPRHFIVTSHGRTASYWLAATLHGHPDVVCLHSMQPLPEFDYGRNLEHTENRASLEETWAALSHYDPTVDELFDAIEKNGGPAKLYGCVHSYILTHLIAKCRETPPRRFYTVINLVRHPVSRCHSFFRRLLSEWEQSETSRGHWYQMFQSSFHQSIAAKIPDDAGGATEDEKVAFVCALVDLMAEAGELTWNFLHVPMERLVTDPSYFAWFLSRLSGGTVQAFPDYIDAVFRRGRLNAIATREYLPVEEFATWKPWQRALFRETAQGWGFAHAYERFGYDMAFVWHARLDWVRTRLPVPAGTPELSPRMEALGVAFASQLHSPLTAPECAFDGRPDTFWASESSGGLSGSAIIGFDFRHRPDTTVTAFTLHQGTCTAALNAVSSVEVQASDDAFLTDIRPIATVPLITDGGEHTYALPSATAQSARFWRLVARGETGGGRWIIGSLTFDGQRQGEPCDIRLVTALYRALLNGRDVVDVRERVRRQPALRDDIIADTVPARSDLRVPPAVLRAFMHAPAGAKPLPGRASFDPTGDRTTTGEAEIVDALLACGERADVVEIPAFTPFNILVRVAYHVGMEQPILGLSLFDRDRTAVFMANTLWSESPFGAAKAGDVRTYHLACELFLPEGEYTAELGLARDAAHVVDRQVGRMRFRVTGAGPASPIGFAEFKEMLAP